MSARGMLLTSEGRLGQTIARAIRGVGAEVEVVTDPLRYVSACHNNNLDFTVVDGVDPQSFHSHLDAFRALAHTSLGRKTILFADITDQSQFIQLLKDDLLYHLVAASRPSPMDRIALTLAKLLKKKTLGMEMYVPWGARISGFELRGSEHKDGVLEALSRYLEAMEVKDRLITLAGLVTDEFLMNAIFDAPIREDGHPMFAEQPRHQRVVLPEPHRAEFRFCCTGDVLVLCVFDTFGSLEPNAVGANLIRTLSGGNNQIRKGTAGAGVGLYMSFSSLSDWIINVVPGRATEMIGFIRVGGTYRDHISTPKSFDLFVAEED